MPVGSTIPSTAHVYPEVFSVCGFQNQLIEVSVTFQPIEPAIMVHGHIRFMVHGSWFTVQGMKRQNGISKMKSINMGDDKKEDMKSDV